MTTPILVTGAHRSGTTWVGQMINLSNRTFYLGELFRPDSKIISPELIPYWYYYITKEHRNSSQIEKELAKVLSLDFVWAERSDWRRFLPSRQVLLKHMRRWFGTPRPIMKDPIAAFSADWLSQTFQINVVCLIRHPAAFAYSLKRANWRFGFDNFTNQSHLMDQWLYPYAQQLENPPDNVVEEAALLWLCIYHVLCAYIERHEEWLLLRLEDISREPVAMFAQIFQELDLPFTSSIATEIWRHSSPDNPVLNGSDLHLIRRNSRAAQEAWRERLTADEAKRIRDIVEPLSARFYTDEDW